MTPREKFRIDPKITHPEVSAAMLLVLYEHGDAGAKVTDPSFLARVRTLSEMTDEQFEKERQHVLFEMGASDYE